MFTAACTYIGVRGIRDFPFSIIVEACMYQVRQPRHIAEPVFMILQSPNYFNIISLVIDLLMLRFIKKIVAPVANVLVIGPLSQSLQNDVAVVGGNHK